MNKIIRDKELNTVLQLFRCAGLGPFFFKQDSKQKIKTFALLFYNFLLVSVFINNIVVILKHSYQGSETESCNTLCNTLWGISFNFIDIIENFYHCFVNFMSLVNLKRDQNFWLNFFKMDQMFKQLKFKIGHKRFKAYLWTKISLITFMYVVFLQGILILYPRPASSYTASTSLLFALPLLLNSISETAFAALVLILYHRFWTINKLLRACLLHYKEEKLLLSGRFKTNNYWFPKPDGLKFEAMEEQSPIVKRAPLLATVNYPEVCFESSFYRRQNIVEVIHQLKLLHFGLYEITNKLNSIFGYNLLFIFAISFFGCTVNLYIVVIFYLKKADPKIYISCLSWMIYYIFRVSHVTWNANTSSNEACKTGDLLHSFQNEMNFAETTLQEELKAFCPQIVECRVEFKAAGFFAIDSHTIFQFIAGVLSNIVFVLQFNKP